MTFFDSPSGVTAHLPATAKLIRATLLVGAEDRGIQKRIFTRQDGGWHVELAVPDRRATLHLRLRTVTYNSL